jgi:hypothetical protein
MGVEKVAMKRTRTKQRKAVENIGQPMNLLPYNSFIGFSIRPIIKDLWAIVATSGCQSRPYNLGA